MRRTRTVFLSLADLIAAALPAGAAVLPASAAPLRRAPQACAGSVSSTHPARGQAKQILDIAEQARKELGLNSVILRVSSHDRQLITAALGESMTGVPAEPSMHFRTGSVAIVYMGAVLLQLAQEGKVSLDDPVSRWLPDAPHGSEITLRMLGSSTSGLHDYVTDPKFLAEFEAAPFREWTPADVIGISASHPLWYEPGTNWSYSHANFQLLGAALEKISGLPLNRLLTERVYQPLGLNQTSSQTTPQIPSPVLHSFSTDRDIYEEATFWNPSWTTAPGAVLVQDVCDLERSARGIGTGELLDAKSFQTQLNPGTVGLGHATSSCPATVCLTNTEARHFGLGVIVVNDWILTNPSFGGYAAIQAYLPSQQLSIAVSVTKGPKSPERNSSETIAERISAALAPEQALKMR